MIIRVGTAPRAAGTTYTEFQAHWRAEHAGVASELPGLRSYIQNHAILENGRPLLPYAGFDACAEIEFDDLVEMDKAFASEHFKQNVSADEAVMIDRQRFNVVLAERRALVDAPEPPDAVRLMTFWRACAGVSHAQLDRELANAGTAASGVAVRHEQLVASVDAHAGRKPAAFDVVDTLAFATQSQACAYLQSPECDAGGWRLAAIGQVVGRLISRVIPIVERTGRT